MTDELDRLEARLAREATAAAGAPPLTRTEALAMARQLRDGAPMDEALLRRVLATLAMLLPTD